jgi:ABC-type bacteriocin/lantibiotic exporter with double-glycine peptidase domain
MAVDPMLTLLTSWPQIGSFLASLERIEKFLLLGERRDGRITVLGDIKNTNVETEQEPIDQFPIQFSNASIAPLESQDGIVHIKSASIKRSDLTMVVGPTGCGKSTLLKAMIGEANVVQGSVLVAQKHLAYCGENVWLRNVTIRDNIIGESILDEAWYKKVTHSCMLADIDDILSGDLAVAGSGGCNLSGGQKQRIVSYKCRPISQLLTK